ncbi:MAG TPA: hypothetical protein VGD42_15565 [Lysobacter sp.]
MKTRTLAFAVLAMVVGLAAPAAAQEASGGPAATPAVAATQDGTGDDRLVCERAKVIGSNKVERVCKTVRQRREEREGAKYQAGKQATDRMMQSRGMCASASCNGQ